MTKQKSTKRALLMSALALLMCVSMLIGSTFAWFTDSVTSSGNIIKSGTLDVTMEWLDGKVAPTDDAAWIDASEGAIFDYDLWEPGYTEVRHIKIANEGTLALKYQLHIVANGEVSELADVIDVYYIDPAKDAITDRAQLKEENKLGTLTDVLANISTTASGNLKAGDKETITLALKMQESAGNKYQGLSIGSDFSIVLFATQYTSESDSFNDQYDAGAELPVVGEADSQAEFVAAIKSGADTIYLEAGNYTMPDGGDSINLRGKKLTIIGNKDVVIDASGVDLRDQFVTNATLTFDGVTVKFGSAEYMGFANTTEMNYQNCDIVGLQYLTGKCVNYDNCNFVSVLNASRKPAYCVGTYTAKEVNFDNCVFMTDGKAILVYAESHFDSQVVNVKDCAFGATASATTSAGDVCAAIEIDASLIKDTYTINFEGTNTVSKNFAGLYRIKKQKDPANVTINQNGIVANAESIKADTQEELDTIVSSGDTVNMNLAAGNYEMPDGSKGSLRGKTITISGTKDTVIDVSNVDTRDQFVTGATIVFDGVTLNFDNGTKIYMGFANTENLIYRNCHITGMQMLFGENVTFENCVLDSSANTGEPHSVWTYGAKNVSFTNCDFIYGNRAINCYKDQDIAGGKQVVNFKNCTFTTTEANSEGAVEINSSAFSVGIEVNMEDCTAPTTGEMAYVSQWDSTDGAKTTINIK